MESKDPYPKNTLHHPRYTVEELNAEF